MAAENTHLTVRPIDVVAAQQIKAQEKQRIVGIVPNFYTSYIYYAAPLTSKQKYSLVSHDVFDPLQFAGAGVTAGIEQARNRFPAYGKGFQGYGRRYAAAFGDVVTRDYLSYSGYFPRSSIKTPLLLSGLGIHRLRLLHALGLYGCVAGR